MPPNVPIIGHKRMPNSVSITAEKKQHTSNNSPLSLMVTMTLFGNMASRVQGDVYFTGVHEIIALTNLPPFHHMQRPFIVKKHSAMGNTFPIVVGFRVSA